MDIASLSTPALRPVNVRTDLTQVADLIELCFGDQMDPDGHEYVRQLRRAAANPSFLRWMPGAREQVSFPLHGYVWIEEERIIGNLSLIPFFNQGRWLYLIANVAVHPDFRRRGIGRKLTQKALWHIHEHGAASAWLQVREDNPAAVDLYRNLGMVERARRTTWVSINASPVERSSPAGIEIRPRQGRDWRCQREWLHKLYPPEITWNLPIDIPAFNPSIVNRIAALINGEKRAHWSIYYNHECIGVLTWEPSRHFADTLWLANAPEWSGQAILNLLHHARTTYSNLRPLMVNYPSGVDQTPFWEAGFQAQNTLIWMEMPFHRDRTRWDDSTA